MEPGFCPRCGKPMEAGYTLDRGHYGVPTLQSWVPGPFKRGWLGGLKFSKDRYAVTTYRCAGCGYLESYANRKAGERDPGVGPAVTC